VSLCDMQPSAPRVEDFHGPSSKVRPEEPSSSEIYWSCSGVTRPVDTFWGARRVPGPITERAPGTKANADLHPNALQEHAVNGGPGAVANQLHPSGTVSTDGELLRQKAGLVRALQLPELSTARRSGTQGAPGELTRRGADSRRRVTRQGASPSRSTTRPARVQEDL